LFAAVGLPFWKTPPLFTVMPLVPVSLPLTPATLRVPPEAVVAPV
jgi:hypothetical protein